MPRTVNVNYVTKEVKILLHDSETESLAAATAIAAAAEAQEAKDVVVDNLQDSLDAIDAKTEEEKSELDGYTEEKKAEVSTVGQSYVDSASQKVTEANTILSAIRNEYGYPFTAATAADMTDTSKIYVYVGNETGYTNGNWYYNNGTAWVSGGVYNSTAFTSDTTLTISGAAADSATVGNTLNKISQKTKNLIDAKLPITSAGTTGFVKITFPDGIPAGTYTLTMEATFSETNYNCALVYSRSTGNYSSADHIRFITKNKSAKVIDTYTFNETIYSLWILEANTVGHSSGQTITINKLQLEQGNESTAYVNGLSAVDDVMRTKFQLESTNDTTDRTGEIISVLTTYGTCRLGKGDFYIHPFTMPPSTTLCGCGDATKVFLLSSTNGTAIGMSSRCTVSDISLYGDAADIPLDIDAVMGVVPEDIEEDTTSPNLWGEGNQNVPSTGYKHLLLTTPINPGTYLVTATFSKLSDQRDGGIYFSTANTAEIGANTIVAGARYTAGTRTTRIVIIPQKVYSVRLNSVYGNANSGIESAFSNINITLYTETVKTRCGIGWTDPDNMVGIIENCRIARFNCAGIIAQDTGTPLDRNLTISNCYVTNCNIGVYLRKNTEFNKITNCTITQNYYGILNRGGNNDVSNSGVDGNVAGIVINADDGSNGGHGTITGCSVNHSDNNSGYGLIVKDTGRMLVNGCNFYYSKIKLENTNGNVISGCGFGTNGLVEIVDGQCSLVSNSIFAEAPGVTMHNNDRAKVVNCFYRVGGAEVLPTVV